MKCDLNREMKCESHVTKSTATSMTSETVCNGAMKGTGHVEITWAGAEHYSGSYDFKGSMEGNATQMSSTFKGDFVKADCGAVKPYIPKP